MNKKLAAIGIGTIIAVAVIILMAAPLSKTSPENTNQSIIQPANTTQKPVVTGKHIIVSLNETIPLSSR